MREVCCRVPCGATMASVRWQLPGYGPSHTAHARCRHYRSWSSENTHTEAMFRGVSGRGGWKRGRLHVTKNASNGNRPSRNENNEGVTTGGQATYCMPA